MLEHQKLVIQGISDDKDLFKKELVKSLAWLNQYDITQLRIWVKEHYWSKHADIITDVFYPKFKRA